MAVKVGEAFVELTTRQQKYDAGLKTANTKLKAFGAKGTQTTSGLASSFGSLGAALPVLGFGALALSISKVIKVTAQQEKAEAQLNAVLRSTKGAAGLTASELKNLASELQNTSEFGDELIIRSEALLLTFTKIGSEVFPRAQQAIVDLSSAMGTDLQTSTIQIGKALNDPILGLTALRRVGIQLTKDQENLVKQLVATGDVAKAQGIILDELETQFGGAAKASADTLGGALNQLKNTFGDLLELEGAGFSQQLKTSLQSINETLKESKPLFEGLGLVIGAIFDLFKMIIGALNSFAETIVNVVGPAVEWLGEKFKKVGALAMNFSEAIGLHETIEIEVLADEKKAKESGEKTKQSLSKEWIKAREDAQKFIKDITTALETPEQRITRMQEENLAKAEELRKKGLISEEEFQQARVDINENAVRQMEDAERRLFAERSQMAQTFLGVAQETLGTIGEAFEVSEQNRLTEIENRKQKQLDQLKITFNAESDKIKKEVKNNKKRERMLGKLEEDRAKKEEQINEEADKAKAKLQRKAFQRQKGINIANAIMGTAGAIVNALQTQPFFVGLALAIVAGALGAAQIAIIASQKAPAMAEGGIVTGPTNAIVGEAGAEAVFPLEGPRGRNTRQMLANDLVDAVSNQQARAEPETIGVLEEEQQMTFNVNVNIGGENLYGTITQGIENREILIDERSLVKR